jgi:transposase
MEQEQVASTGCAEAVVLVAIELSKTNWLLAVHDPSTSKVSHRRVNGGDADALIALLDRCRRGAAARAAGAVGMECVFEAGYDGFWLQRRLAQAGIVCRVMDPASLKVDRRARRVKTDRVDAESLLRALQAWRRGDRRACSFVRVPSVAEEDARRPHRELARLTKERVGHVNRIKGLLALHGVRDYRPLRHDRREALAELRTGYGGMLPARCRREVERELSRLELVLQHITEVEEAMAEPTLAEMPAAGSASEPSEQSRDVVAVLQKLTCVGRETAVVLAREVLCRDFRDRRSIAAFAGLTPSPYSSGRLQHEQGISKAGNAVVRARLVQLAWRWVRFQTGSDITAWFVARTRGNSKRNRCVAIVAVARKLLIALWRYATQGLVPTGAKLRPGAV